MNNALDPVKPVRTPASPRSKALLRNQNGQRIGAKGTRTRQKVIETCLALLEQVGVRDLSVVEVARAADTSAATFYVYFDSVQDVVLAALEQAPQAAPELLAMLAGDWTPANGHAKATAFVRAYFESWGRHRTIYRIRNLMSDEGDPRFLAARFASARPVLAALEKPIIAAQHAGRLLDTLHSFSSAGVLMAMLERVAAVGTTPNRENGITYETMLASTAHVLLLMFGLA